ncbi:DUF6575 domain-containing protein [Paenibacillus farraposensis]|uniref:DUF6575 domain-containing protein n=1 Tax=Paenibacillus farraposensis TaxID=2807095 RepID=A0ABW4DH89_9BACL|nr:DUF6575 domain-containing protein [Paenibacillus farraposensis]MCC3378443.1 hypothetical protein [Paenibacillus farraposensis]
MDFKLPLPIGALNIIDVYEYVDGPKVFSCISDLGQKYIVNWIDTSPTTDTWFYVAVSDKRLQAVNSGEISLREVILNSERKSIYQVVTPARGLGEVIISKRKVTTIIEDELPDVDSFVDVFVENTEIMPSKGETPCFSSTTEGKQAAKREPVTNEVPVEVVPEVIKKNKQVSKLPPKEDTRKVALFSRRDVLDLSFNVKGTHQYELDALVLGYALVHTQELVNYIPLEKKQSGRYKLGKDQSRKGKLKAVGLYAASFGIRLESEVESDLLGDTELSHTLEALMKLIESTDNIEKFKIYIGNLNIKATKIYYDFLKLLNEEDIELTAEWASPNSKHRISRLDHVTISNAIRAINEETKQEQTIIKIVGDLVGINVKRNKFNLITDNEEHVHGTISKALRDKQFTVPLRVEATVKETTEVNLLSGKEVTSNTLLDIKAL